jgi:hypothetical protein
MSRFADPTITERMPLGACQCPGTPHAEGDWIEMRTEVGAEELARLQEGDSVDLLSGLAVNWNLFDADGTKAPVDREHIDRLFGDTFGIVNDWTKKNLRLTTVPKGSSVRSPTSGQANGSRRPSPATAT